VGDDAKRAWLKLIMAAVDRFSDGGGSGSGRFLSWQLIALQGQRLRDKEE
jgi:hypothetical protein